jgi:hypothetical protein
VEVDAVVVPVGEVAVEGVPGRVLVGQVAPGDCGAVVVEDGVHDGGQVMFARAADVRAFGCGGRSARCSAPAR